MKRLLPITICCLVPLTAFGNPYVLNPSSLVAFWAVVFWAMIVESGIVALLLTFRGVQPLRLFLSYFVSNSLVFLLLFQPLLHRGLGIPALEVFVVLVDGLAIKALVRIEGLRGDSYHGVGWLNSIAVSCAGNAASFFVGLIAIRKPWVLG